MTNSEKTFPASHQILRLKNVQKLIGLSRSSIYLRIANGTFPRPINLGGKAVGWLESEVQQWLENQVTSSRS